MALKFLKKYTLTSSILAYLNILIGILLILTAYRLITTELGKSLMALGYLTLTVSTVLKVAQKW